MVLVDTTMLSWDVADFSLLKNCYCSHNYQSTNVILLKTFYNVTKFQENHIKGQNFQSKLLLHYALCYSTCSIVFLFTTTDVILKLHVALVT